MKPKYLFDGSRKLRRPLEEAIRSHQHLILLLDFDGTLAPIRTTPDRALLPARTARILARLSDHPDVTTGIVTGRSMPDILAKMGRSRPLLIANHGFEIFYKNTRWIHPWAEAVTPVLRKAAVRLRRRIRRFPGVSLEHKRYTLAVHFRAAHSINHDDLAAAVGDAMLPFRNQLRITIGKKVMELRPNIPWNKGSAVASILGLLKQERRSYVLYVGDDLTDEDAFETLRHSGGTVVVGHKDRTAAEYWVRNPAEVTEFLVRVTTLMSERKSI